MTLYYLKYNNYYNRIVKQESDIEAYKNYLITDESNNVVPSATVENVAFDFGDGVNTTHILKNWPYAIPDYLVITDDYGINSRWFIIDAKSTRKYGQYEISLRRDLMVDFYESFINSPAYIERGIINRNNKLIYNSENMQLNQIKTSETLLKDITSTPWIVAYVAKNYVDVATSVSTPTANIETQFELDRSELKNTYYSYQFMEPNFYVEVNANITNDYSSYIINNNGTIQSTVGQKTITTLDGFATPTSAAKSLKDNYDDYVSDFEDLFPSTANITLQPEFTNQLLNMAGKVIKDTATDTYFTFSAEYFEDYSRYAIPRNSGAYNKAIEMLKSIPGFVVNENNNYAVGMWLQPSLSGVKIYNIRSITGAEVSMTVPPKTTRQQLKDAPWDLLCMPLLPVKYKLNNQIYESKDEVSANMAQALFNKNTGGVYDVQLLPYCPCTEYWDYEENYFDLDNLGEGTHYSLLQSNDETIQYGFGLWANQSSFRANIYGFTPILNPSDNIEFKVNNECDMYRLISPNYSGAFEFKATSNGGIINFEANCTYKPYQPYIHINPVFGELYGTDFNDNRGLICGGNFSMPLTSDSWTTYQIQNKSYKESFYRQIQNMETTYDIQREQQKAGALLGGISSTISGATSGAIAGSVGGVPGAIAGGIVGGATALGGNIYGATKDLEYADKLHDEATSYARDQFNLSLQNIKALPNTISNVGAFDVNYKYYPVLEYYTCTDEEKEALRNKIQYNGMTINVIDNINKYVYNDGSYISAQLIRITDLDEDYHVAAEIASELHKGIYI